MLTYDYSNNIHVKKEAHGFPFKQKLDSSSLICCVLDFAATSRNRCTCGGHCCRICHWPGMLILRFYDSTFCAMSAQMLRVLIVRLCEWKEKKKDWPLMILNVKCYSYFNIQQLFIFLNSVFWCSWKTNFEPLCLPQLIALPMSLWAMFFFGCCSYAVCPFFTISKAYASFLM
jgi:hypothetical protein